MFYCNANKHKFAGKDTDSQKLSMCSWFPAAGFNMVCSGDVLKKSVWFDLFFFKLNKVLFSLNSSLLRFL